MSSEYEDKPYSDSHLDSPEYRQRLMRKLNTLIAVLEVACVKVRRSLAGPDADVERLTRIQKNLTDTLQVCMRAKKALERAESLPKNLPAELGKMSRSLPPARKNQAASKKGTQIEMSSPEELDKFSKLGPIETKDIRSVNLDDLCRQLLGF